MKAQHIVLFVIAGIIGFFLAFYVSSTGAGGDWFLPVCLVVAIGIPLVLLIRLVFINKPVHRAGKSEEASARTADPPPGSGTLFVYRDQFVGKLVGTDLSIDDKPVGQLRGKTFYRFDLPAGQYTLKSAMGSKMSGSLAVTLKTGERVYVHESFEMGMIRNSLSLAIAAAPKGARALSKCRLLQGETALVPARA